MPTKNNLKAQISWLLAENPFIASATSLVTYDPTAPTGSTTAPPTLSEGGDHFEDDVSEEISARATSPMVTEHERSATFVVDIHRPPDAQRVAPNMARLRTTPREGKPRLILADRTPQSSPSAGRMREEKKTERLGVFISAASRSMTPKTAKKEDFDPEIEAIDLTDGPAARANVGPVRLQPGTKRKSEEFEQDFCRKKLPGTARVRNPSSPTTEAEGFAHIDDLVKIPESPPPPYSTFNQKLRAHRTNLTSEERGVDVNNEAQKPEAADHNFPGDSRGSMLAHIEPKGHDHHCGHKHCHSGCTASKSSPGSKPSGGIDIVLARNLVADSEDEDFVDFDHGFANQTAVSVDQKKGPPIVLLPVSPQMAMSSSQPAAPDGKIASSSCTVRREAMPSEGLETSPTSRTPLSLQNPCAVQTAVLSEEQPTLVPAGLTKEQKASVHIAVTRFFDTEGQVLEQHFELATVKFSRARQDFIDQLDADMVSFPDKTRLEQARNVKEALQLLITYRSVFEAKTNMRTALTRKVKEDLTQFGEFDAAEAAALTSNNKSLEETIFSTHRSLEVAGFAEYTVPLPVIASDQVLIRSTQTTLRSQNNRPDPVQDCHAVPQTQFVKTTQAVVQDVRTPSRHIHLAEERVAESSLPPPVHLSKKPVHFEIANNIGNIERNDRMSIADLQGSSHPVRNFMSCSRPVSTYGKELDDPLRSTDDFGEDSDGQEVEEFGSTMGPPPLNLDAEPVHDDFFNYEGSESADFEGENQRESSEYPSMHTELLRQQHGRHPTALQDVSPNRAARRTSPQSSRKNKSNIPAMALTWSDDVRNELSKRFGLTGFRPGQLEAINATLCGEHCFVLMPTGGGKSLCYQLPSVVTSGKTRGVSIVISPLLSLMEDQVAACTKRFKMNAFMLNGDTPAGEKAEIMQILAQRDPTGSMHLLYLTPEMLSKNQRMIDMLQRLHQRGRLARIVIDEAHCVSQWGHDFRPDYKALGDVIRHFAGVPIIALTATATQLVRKDVMTNLGITSGRLFSQSFNRPNLSYEVRPKERGVVNSIADLISSRYSGKSGIVYCLSRKTCQSVAEKLVALGIQAHHYHAGMESKVRSQVQKDWQANQYHVIVATIAFGMGIDKADVRFVIHHSLPKSLEGYYQETGRAGRDGRRSDCFLYYTYGDCKVLRKMIAEGDGSAEQKARQDEMLRSVIQFCENKSDCRRVQVLNYFSEPFRRENCKRTCDNCKSDAVFQEVDLTEEAAAAVRLVEQVQDNKVTLHQCVDAFRGWKNPKFKNTDVDEFGAGQGLEKEDAERLFNHLLEARALDKWSEVNRAGFAVNYVKLGPKCKGYHGGRLKFKMQVRLPGQRAARTIVKRKAPQKGAKSRAEYPSTNVSSPIRRPAKRDLQDFAFEENDGDDSEAFEQPLQSIRTNGRAATRPNAVSAFASADDDYADFAPIRTGTSRQTSSTKTLSRPITIDDRLAGLTDFQKVILQDFMQGAKDVIRDIKIKTGLRQAPFSDTVLREAFLQLPGNLTELRQVRGTNPEMVTRYGQKLLLLINNTREALGGKPPVSERSRPANLRKAYEVDDDDSDDQPFEDPNHQVVIVVDDSDEETKPSQAASIYSFDDGDDAFYDKALEDDLRDTSLHRSHHFTPHARPIPANRLESEHRYAPVQATKPAARRPKPSGSTKTSTGIPRASFVKKKNAMRKNGSSGSGSSFARREGSYSGGSRRGGSRVPRGGGARRPTGHPTGGGSGRRTGGGRGVFGAGSIAAMPT